MMVYVYKIYDIKLQHGIRIDYSIFLKVEAKSSHSADNKIEKLLNGWQVISYSQQIYGTEGI